MMYTIDESDVYLTLDSKTWRIVALVCLSLDFCV